MICYDSGLTVPTKTYAQTDNTSWFINQYLIWFITLNKVLGWRWGWGWCWVVGWWGMAETKLLLFDCLDWHIATSAKVWGAFYCDYPSVVGRWEETECKRPFLCKCIRTVLPLFPIMVYENGCVWKMIWLNLILAFTTNHMPCKVWGKITYPCQKFAKTVEVWEWIRNFIPRIIMDVITWLLIHAGIEVIPY